MALERWLGDASRLPFGALLSLRAQILHAPGTTALCVIALAASVGLAASVEMASRSVRGAVERTSASLAGRARLELSAGEQGVPEALVETVRGTDGVASGSPVVERTFRIADGPQRGLALHVLGIDLLYEGEVRDYSVAQGGLLVRDPLRLVAGADSIVVSARLAARLGVAEGDRLQLGADGRRHAVTVRGLLSGTLAEAFSGQIAVMDVYALQALVGAPDRLTRIDVAIEPGADVDAVRERLADSGPPGVVVRPVELRAHLLHSILDAIDVAIWSTVCIALLLSLFATYAVVSISVDRRIQELALLRAAGMDARRVSLSIVTDACIVAALGTLLGVIGAIVAAGPFVSVLSRASQHLERVEIEPLGPAPATFAIALLAGLPLAILASVEPALRAGRRSPLDVIRDGRASPSRTRVAPGVVAVTLGAGVLCAAACTVRVAAPASVRLIAAVLLGVATAGIGAGSAVVAFFPSFQRALGRIAPRVGYLVAGWVHERAIETGTTVAIWAAIVAGLLALTSAVHSVAASVDEFFAGMAGPTAVIALPEDPLEKSRTARDLFAPETVARVRATPGIEDVAEYLGVTVPFGGEEVLVSSVDVRTLDRHGGLRSLAAESGREAAKGALLRGELLMTDAFARRFGVAAGDAVTLPTKEGPRAFRISGTTRDYGGRSGTLQLDDATFRRWFEARGARGLALWTRAPLEDVIARITAPADAQAIFFLDPAAYASLTRRKVAAFDDLVMLPVAVVGAGGVLSLLNLLMGNVAARRRDVAVLRASGGTSADVIAIVLVNALLIGATGTFLGVVLGFGWGGIVSDAIAAALGWVVDYRMRVRDVGIAIAASLCASLAAGVAPALAALRSRAGGAGAGSPPGAGP